MSKKRRNDIAKRSAIARGTDYKLFPIKDANGQPCTGYCDVTMVRIEDGSKYLNPATHTPYIKETIIEGVNGYKFDAQYFDAGYLGILASAMFTTEDKEFLQDIITFQKKTGIKLVLTPYGTRIVSIMTFPCWCKAQIALSVPSQLPDVDFVVYGARMDNNKQRRQYKEFMDFLYKKFGFYNHEELSIHRFLKKDGFDPDGKIVNFDRDGNVIGFESSKIA